MQYMDKIGEKIKKLRFERGMTLKDLSDKTGLSVSFLSQIERGSSSIAITSLKKLLVSLMLRLRAFLKKLKITVFFLKKDAKNPLRFKFFYGEYIGFAESFREKI